MLLLLKCSGCFWGSDPVFGCVRYLIFCQLLGLLGPFLQDHIPILLSLSESLPYFPLTFKLLWRIAKSIHQSGGVFVLFFPHITKWILSMTIYISDFPILKFLKLQAPSWKYFVFSLWHLIIYQFLIFCVKIHFKAMVLDMKDDIRKCRVLFQSSVMYFRMHYRLCNMNYDFVYIEWGV